MKNIKHKTLNSELFSLVIIISSVIAPSTFAQEPEPAATPFDMTFRADEDVVPPVRVEFSAGTLNADVSDQPGRQGNAGLPNANVRAIIHPYQHLYNPRTGSHLLALPIDIEMGIDGRSSKPYFQRIDVPIASWSYDRGQGDFLRINIGQYRHAGSPQYSLGQQMPININSFNPINLEFFTKTYDDDHVSTIYKMQFALPF